MITLGLDPHPGSHTVVALDDSGVSLGHLRVPFPSRRWAVEGAGNHFISMFVGQLLSLGESVSRYRHL